MKAKEEIYFRSSSAGKIMTDAQGSQLTENQLKTLKEYQERTRLALSGNAKPLTENMKNDMLDWQARKDAPFQLSETAKGAVEDVWRFNEKGYFQQIESKYTDKGIFGEEFGFNMLTEVDGRFYTKNTKRIFKDNRTGEFDNMFTLDGKKIIQDVKCCWDTKTFMNSDFSKDYEWQGRDYMDLAEADEFWLRYCLVDCPEHLYEKEKDKIFFKYYSNSMTDVEQSDLEKQLEPLFQQLRRNLIYTDNPAYTLEERVKTFKITRDDLIHAKYTKRIPACLDYYQTIKLNG